MMAPIVGFLYLTSGYASVISIEFSSELFSLAILMTPAVKKLRAERVRLVEEKGGIGTKRERCETGINEHSHSRAN